MHATPKKTKAPAPAATRADIADDVKKALSLTDAAAAKTVSAVLDAIADRARDGQRVELRGLVTFEKRSRKARPGRNIATGEKIEILARDVIVAKASKALSEGL